MGNVHKGIIWSIMIENKQVISNDNNRNVRRAHIVQQPWDDVKTSALCNEWEKEELDQLEMDDNNNMRLFR